MYTLNTFISPLLKDDRTPITRDGRPIYWLDELLEGGIQAPGDLQRPFTILLCGPPGAGKSLFLQQIAYCRGLQSLLQYPENPESWDRSVLISTEVMSAATAENMTALGMSESVSVNNADARVFWTDDFRYTQEQPVAQNLSTSEPLEAFNLPVPLPPVTILGTSPSTRSWVYRANASQVVN